MLAGALILGEAGTWIASAAEISDNAAESAETAEAEISETADAADVMVESVETESSGDDGLDSEDSEAVVAEEADPEIYTELMDYIDATSALLAEYSCDYDGTLDIDIDSGEITDQNGESVDVWTMRWKPRWKLVIQMRRLRPSRKTAMLCWMSMIPRSAWRTRIRPCG